MVVGFEVVLFAFLIIAAVVAIQARDLLTAVVALTVFSFLTALLEVVMGAVDVGFTEAVERRVGDDRAAARREFAGAADGRGKRVAAGDRIHAAGHQPRRV